MSCHKATQPHSHTATQPHNHTATQTHTANQPHSHSATPPHSHTATQTHTSTQPHSHTATQTHTVTQNHKATAERFAEKERNSFVIMLFIVRLIDRSIDRCLLFSSLAHTHTPPPSHRNLAHSAFAHLLWNDYCYKLIEIIIIIIKII